MKGETPKVTARNSPLGEKNAPVAAPAGIPTGLGSAVNVVPKAPDRLYTTRNGLEILAHARYWLF